jgi:hypothetical protein
MSHFHRLAAVALTASLLIPAGSVAAQDASPLPVIPEPNPSSVVHEFDWDLPASEDISMSGAMGPGISVSEVDSAPDGEILLINGTLIVDPDGEIRLWEGLAESHPPQGAGRSLGVNGLDEDTIDWTEAGGVRWSDDIQLLGHVVDAVLVIDPLVQ